MLNNDLSARRAKGLIVDAEIFRGSARRAKGLIGDAE